MGASVVGPVCPHGRDSIKCDLVIYSKNAHDIVFEDVEHRRRTMAMWSYRQLLFCRLTEGTYSHSVWQRKWKAPDASEMYLATYGKGTSGVQSATPETSQWTRIVSLKSTRQHSEKAKHDPTGGDYRWKTKQKQNKQSNKQTNKTKNPKKNPFQIIFPRNFIPGIAESCYGLVRVSPASGQVCPSSGFGDATENRTFSVIVL